MKIIALYGPQGAGKSEAATAIHSLDRFWVRMSFADPLYEMVSVLVNENARYLDKSAPIEWLGGKTLRQLLQTLGTEWGRDMVSNEVWLNHLRRRIESAHKQGMHVVVDDMRFQNEYEMLRDMGAEIVRIDRPGHEFRGEHASERDQPGFIASQVLENHGAVESFWRDAQSLARLVGGDSDNDLA